MELTPTRDGHASSHLASIAESDEMPLFESFSYHGSRSSLCSYLSAMSTSGIPSTDVFGWQLTVDWHSLVNWCSADYSDWLILWSCDWWLMLSGQWLVGRLASVVAVWSTHFSADSLWSFISCHTLPSRAFAIADQLSELCLALPVGQKISGNVLPSLQLCG